MNRLRAAYVEMDPTLSRYLVTAWYDDTAGLGRTYSMGAPLALVAYLGTLLEVGRRSFGFGPTDVRVPAPEEAAP